MPVIGVVMAIGDICSVEGCEKINKYHTKLCSMHYSRFKKYKSYDEPPRRKKHIPEPCLVDECVTLATHGKYCQLHYRRMRDFGSFDKPKRDILNEAVCTKCGELIEGLNNYQRWKLKRDGLVYHLKVCGNSSEKKIKISSDNMKQNNPMFSEDTRNKMSDTLKRIGHKPTYQGGNGRGLTGPQELLLNALGNKWEAELVVKTGLKPKDGYPHHYKIDIGSHKRMIAVELDGGSHYSIKQREKDLKKTEVLESLGWKVLRFTNAEVNNNLNSVVKEINEAT